MAKNESKFWHEIKKSTPKISWTRIENTSSLGTPDLLGCNSFGTFFTVELKVTKGNKVTFSPHQIAFHVKHPTNTFICVETPDQRCPKLYPGSAVRELAACGLSACELERLQLESWSGLERLLLEACAPELAPAH